MLKILTVKELEVIRGGGKGGDNVAEEIELATEDIARVKGADQG